MTYTNIEVYSLHFDDLVIHSEHIKEKEIGKLPIMNRSTWISSSIHSKLIRRLLCHGWMQSVFVLKKEAKYSTNILFFVTQEKISIRQLSILIVRESPHPHHDGAGAT